MADGVVSCYDCYPLMECPASFSNFKLGGAINRDLDGQYSTDRLIFVLSFRVIRPDHSGAQKENTEIFAAEINIFCVSFLYFCGPITVGWPYN